ncbi:MAG TPA: insulinase family protein [Vicinamibacterales bacterium]|nr:insulinase family protein [Vicinamibacterales bacterium]
MTSSARALALVAAVLLAAPITAQTQWPSERPPRPLVARGVDFPPYQMRTLENGLQVVVVSHHEQPAVTLRMLIKAGAAHDPEGKPGVASMTAGLLDQGTATKGAQEIASAIESVGGGLGVGAGNDLTFVNAVVLKNDLTLALDLVSDIVRNAAFSEGELDRIRPQLLSSMQVSYDDPDYIAGVVFDRLVYGFHPYGRPSAGTPQSAAVIAREDLVAFHKAWYVPSNAILAVVGDVTADDAFARVERAFSAWTAAAAPAVAFPEPPPPTRRVVVVDKPGAVQTEIRVGHLGVPRNHPDYMALNLAIRILGGEGANRLYGVLRSDRGLTYSASAEMEALKQAGAFMAETNTRTEATGQSLRLMVDEFWRLQREQIASRELQGAQDYMAGSFPLTIETPSAIALQVLNQLFYGLDLQELESFRERVYAVTPEEIQRVAAKYLAPDRLSVVLVGDAAKFTGQLKSVGFTEFEQIPASALDLGSASLKRGGLLNKGGFLNQSSSSSQFRHAATRNWTEPRTGTGTGPAGQSVAEARTLIARAIERKGGLDRLRAVRTLEADASLVIEGGTTVVGTKTQIAYPDKYRVEAETAGANVTHVYASGEAWLETPTGLREAPDFVRDEAAAAVSRDLIGLLLRAWDGRVSLAQAPAGASGLSALRMTQAGRPDVTVFFDPATADIVRLEYERHAPDGAVTEIEDLSDYRVVDGIRFAFRATTTTAGGKIDRRLRAIRVNPELSPSLFQRPGK